MSAVRIADRAVWAKDLIRTMQNTMSEARCT
jgi:hypothetical protein